MKRFTTSLALVFALALGAGVVYSSEEGAWFDMDNCEMCAPMMAEKGMMQNISWENHSISNGMLAIASATEKYEDAFGKACARMDEMGKKMMADKDMKMKLCGHCESYTSLMGAGATIEKIETKSGHVTLMTSSDKETVEKIHAHVERNNVEMAKMAKMMEAQMKEAGHEGHSHD